MAELQQNFHFRCEYIQNKKTEEDMETVYMLVNKREGETQSLCEGKRRQSSWCGFCFVFSCSPNTLVSINDELQTPFYEMEAERDVGIWSD